MLCPCWKRVVPSRMRAPGGKGSAVPARSAARPGLAAGGCAGASLVPITARLMASRLCTNRRITVLPFGTGLQVHRG